MKIIPFDPLQMRRIVRETAGVLKSGGLVIAPTDTVYGALVDAANRNAVSKLIAFKNRPLGKPISVFVNGFEMLKRITVCSGKQLQTLRGLLPGPFTAILQFRSGVDFALLSERKTLGVRYPQHPFINTLLEAYKKPVTATSANLSGRPARHRITTLLDELPSQKKKLIDLVIDNRDLPRNKPSTIIDLTDHKVQILRRGDVVYETQNVFTTSTPAETRALGAYITRKHLDALRKNCLFFILEGDLGSGKTELVKGIASVFNIRTIISPTYVVYYEYPMNGNSHFVHADLYMIDEEEEFKYLGLDAYIKRGNVVCIEWGEKAGTLKNQMSKNAKVLYIHIAHVKENERRIKVKS